MSRLAAVTVAVAAVAVLVSFQARQPVSDAQRCWPPRPQDIVNINEFQTPSTPSVPQSFPMFTVPANRWLVVTDFVMMSSTFAFLPAQLVQDIGGVETVKFTPSYANQQIPEARNVYGFFSPVGLAFEPGSTVALKQVSASTSVIASLTGYLTR